MPEKKRLGIENLIAEAGRFANRESKHDEPNLYGVTDGKAVGTYLEHKFTEYLEHKYDYELVLHYSSNEECLSRKSGNQECELGTRSIADGMTIHHITSNGALGSSAFGIDFPGLGVDIKVTSIRQPQSSCPYRSARQKIYGLGYNLLVFVYDKTDDHNLRTARLRMLHTIFIESDRTADFQMTKGILEILKNEGNTDDLVAFMHDRNLPIDDIQAREIAEEILAHPPMQGYLTISNALQWRLQYARVIQKAGTVEGIRRIN